MNAGTGGQRPSRAPGFCRAWRPGAFAHILGTSVRAEQGSETMTAEDNDHTLSTPLTDMTPAHASVALLECLADKLGSRASVTVVYGDPVTSDGVTVIPVAEVAFGFGGGTGGETGTAKNGEGAGGGGGAAARPRGFIEIKNGTATYKPLRDPWVDVAVPLAALLVGMVIPRLTRRLAKRRSR
ncbi:spore germination protein GerW family protein [Streptomyces sp. E11-3]|uniref:spore germination protein GerW family protein n=1 Tax=Streptomyces sp. E11-3 TaxID=3110112 RepID=UPI00397F9AE4